MKFLSLLHKKEKSRAPAVRHSNPCAEYKSDGSSSGHSNSSFSSSKRRSKGVRSYADSLFLEQHEHLTEAFRIIDKNNDGKISNQELKAMWASIGETVTHEELQAMVEEVDVNGDGEIDLQEFITLNRKFGLGLEDHEDCCEGLQLAFILADVNRDGRISAGELEGVMKQLGMKKITVEESSAMLRYVDSDQDDLISYEEFERLMASSIFKGEKH